MIIISDCWDGRLRKLCSHFCLQCRKEFFAPIKAKAKCCSRECNGLSKRTRVVISCFKCHKDFERDPSKVRENNYCSRACKELDQQIGGPLALPHYKSGEYEYRSRALRLYGEICRRCSFDEDVRMLDVHHIDGNRKNGAIENLVVLCVWCHALYTRKILGPSPNWDGVSPARRNNVGSNPTGSTTLGI